MRRIRKRDSYKQSKYINNFLVEKPSKWYDIDYFELHMIPLFKYFKSNTDFRIEFFFSGEVVADNEDEIRNMLMNYSKFSTKKPKFEENLNNTKTIETEI